MRRITFITTGQPSTNPRLVKEVDTLINLGYTVNVIYCFYQSWASKFDSYYIEKNPGAFHLCGGNPVDENVKFLKTKIRFKLSNYLFGLIKKTSFAENAISRTHNDAVRLAKKLKADIYIAHNLGALPAAVLAATYSNAKVGYDAEDMHSGQFTDKSNSGYLLNRHIEEKYFPKINYFTAASPLIAEKYKSIYPFLSPVIVNNVFPAEIIDINLEIKPILRLFWYSQTIGSDRGIETVIAAMGISDYPFELHLLGNHDKSTEDYFRTLAEQSELKPEQIKFYKPISPQEILVFSSKFDIGIASETGSPLNRDICLTNKIFTYIQSGLALIASDTAAQKLFLEEFHLTGKLYTKDDSKALAEVLGYFAENPKILQQTKMHNYGLGQTTLNWENESKKFVAVVEKTLGI